MAFDSLILNPGVGGSSLLCDTFVDTDAQTKVVVYGASCFGVIDGPYQAVDATHGLPVHQQTGATWAVSIASTLTVTGAGGTFPVTDSGGSLTVDAPVGTPVFVRLSDGAAAITTLPVSLASVPSHDVTNAGTFAVQAAQSGTWNVTVNTALPAGTNAIGKLSANSGVDIGDVDVTSVPADPFGVNADAASATGSISAKLRFIASTGIPITGTVTVGSHAVTNAGTFVVQENGSALTSLQLIDDVVFTDDAAFTPATSKVMMVGAEFDDAAPDSVDEGDAGAVRMSANRNLYVRIRDNAGNERGLNIDANGALAATVTNATAANLNCTEASAASSLTSLQLIDDVVYTDDTSTHSTGSSKGVLLMAAATPTDASVNANDIGAVAMTTDRKLHVSVQDALPAGTNAIGKLSSNSGVTIGAVEIASSQTLGTVTTVTTVTTCSTVTTLTTLTGGGVAHDGIDSGNPVKVGARCALTLSDDTMVSNADRTDLVSDGDGALIVRESYPLADLTSERVSNTDGASTAFTNFGATANVRNIITGYSIFNSSVSTVYVDFRDGTAGAILWTVPLPAGGGANLAIPNGIFKTTANTALAFDVSAATSTVYISVTGFRSKVV